MERKLLCEKLEMLPITTANTKELVFPLNTGNHWVAVSATPDLRMQKYEID